jgi:hypothetical protein
MATATMIRGAVSSQSVGQSDFRSRRDDIMLQMITRSTRSTVIALACTLAGCHEQSQDVRAPGGEDKSIQGEPGQLPEHTAALEHELSSRAAPAPGRLPSSTNVETGEKADTSSPDTTTPAAAMATFLAALRTKDSSLLLSCFSHKRTFYLVTSGTESATRSAFKYEQLSKGLRPGGDFRGFLFGDDDADDSLANMVWDEGKPLQWLPDSNTTFVPASHRPTPGEAPLFAVSWAREGPGFVVREIRTPF